MTSLQIEYEMPVRGLPSGGFTIFLLPSFGKILRSQPCSDSILGFSDPHHPEHVIRHPSVPLYGVIRAFYVGYVA